ncbi:MAG: 3'(2'),5'-bisphosphate nucleotidase CysQ [Bacteroidales bacterium]|nr:3'(2'),5'-bisphosphate nucleotidase CysQ [Bacteroidales bacterium]MBK9358993.1 3'(2'),5'-bisphosphate nucleotidase CysQ [Bacteroidales bacterium]
MITPYISHLTFQAIKAAIKAGQLILDIYNSEYITTFKEDNSPLTTADSAAHRSIAADLAETGFPVLSEEGKEIPREVRQQWHYFWMVDPLDGTKEFISRNGEFTVNIALIAADTPVIGVIYVPVSGMLYFGNKETGSYSLDCSVYPFNDQINGLENLLVNCLKLPLAGLSEQFTILASRSHLTPETSAIIDNILKEYPDSNIVNTGSSLKFCRLAEGNAHFYPRFSPTMEWDTAAGHAIAAYSGIQIKAWPGPGPLKYNKESLVNPWFIARVAGLPDFEG